MELEHMMSESVRKLHGWGWSWYYGLRSQENVKWLIWGNLQCWARKLREAPFHGGPLWIQCKPTSAGAICRSQRPFQSECNFKRQCPDLHCRLCTYLNICYISDEQRDLVYLARFMIFISILYLIASGFCDTQNQGIIQSNFQVDQGLRI